MNLSDVKLPGIPSTSVRQSGSCHCAAEYICRRALDVVDFSSRCDNYLHSLRIAGELRQMRHQVPIILGGPQATITDTATLNRFEFIDYVVRHEAEHSLPALLEALGGKQGLEHIPGIIYRRDEAKRRFI